MQADDKTVDIDTSGPGAEIQFEENKKPENLFARTKRFKQDYADGEGKHPPCCAGLASPIYH